MNENIIQPEVSFVSSLLPVVTVVFIISIGVIVLHLHFRKNLYQQTLKQEELKTKHQRELLQASIEAQEKERKEVAQNMHDELGATLSIIRMQLVQLEQQHHSDEKMHTTLNRLRLASESALTNMRNLSHQLMPPQLDEFGLVNTLEILIRQLNESGELRGHLHVDGSIGRLPSAIELSVYRLCMELINNTIRHSQADSLAIKLVLRGTRLQVHYTDNGKGIPKRFIAGHGFKSMEARINSLGGVWEYGNSNTGGFYAKAEVQLGDG